MRYNYPNLLYKEKRRKSAVQSFDQIPLVGYCKSLYMGLVELGLGLILLSYFLHYVGVHEFSFFRIHVGAVTSSVPTINLYLTQPPSLIQDWDQC